MSQTWAECPTAKQIKMRIHAFVDALRAGDLGRAFDVCPPVAFRQGHGFVSLDGPFDATSTFVQTAIVNVLRNQSTIDTIVDTEPASWGRFLTPPGNLDFADLAFEFPATEYDDDSGDAVDPADDASAGEAGEVLANLHIQGEASDVTGKYMLIEQDGAWVLGFRELHVM